MAQATKPKEYANIPDDQFAIPEEYKYPMDTPERCRAALAYWGQNKDRYPPEQQTKIEARMKRLAAAHGVTADFSDDAVTIERDARLFEAGEYKDKGVTVTEDDLDTIVANFEESPVKIEHMDTPFDGALGMVKRIWRQGKELWGKIAFQPVAWALAEAAGAKKLSVCISKDKLAITEVSLVSSPRVASAQVFAGDTVSFDAGDIVDLLPREDVIAQFAALMGGRETKTSEVKTNMAVVVGDEKKPDETVDFTAELEKQKADAEAARKEAERTRAEVDSLKFKLREADVAAQIKDLKAAGKLIPACEDFAKAILLHGDNTVKFGETETDVAELFGKFLEASPVIVKFGETGKVGEGEEVTFSEDEIAMAMKLQSDKTREQVIEQMKKYAN